MPRHLHSCGRADRRLQPVGAVPLLKIYASTLRLCRTRAGNVSASSLARASSNTGQHKPSDAVNLQRSRSRIAPAPTRDFVPWRFSDACRRCAWRASSSRRPRNLHRNRKLGSFAFRLSDRHRGEQRLGQLGALRRGSALTLSAQLAKFAQPFKSNAQIWANAT
jgi:hypothetical protein